MGTLVLCLATCFLGYVLGYSRSSSKVINLEMKILELEEKLDGRV